MGKDPRQDSSHRQIVSGQIPPKPQWEASCDWGVGVKIKFSSVIETEKVRVLVVLLRLHYCKSCICNVTFLCVLFLFLFLFIWNWKCLRHYLETLVKQSKSKKSESVRISHNVPCCTVQLTQVMKKQFLFFFHLVVSGHAAFEKSFSKNGGAQSTEKSHCFNN